MNLRTGTTIWKEEKKGHQPASAFAPEVWADAFGSVSRETFVDVTIGAIETNDNETAQSKAAISSGQYTPTESKKEPGESPEEDGRYLNPSDILQSLRSKADSQLGRYSTAFLNAIGEIFVEKTAGVFEDLTNRNGNGNVIKARIQMLGVLDEFSKSLAPVTPAAVVFGKIANILHNTRDLESRPNFGQLKLICSNKLPKLGSDYDSCLNALNSIGAPSVPLIDLSQLGDDQDDE